METQPLRVVQTIYEAGARGDIVTALAQYSPACAVHEPDSLPFGGLWQGPAGIGQVLGIVFQVFDKFEPRPQAFIADGERVAVLVDLTVRVRKTGEELTMPLLELYTVRDGQVVEFRPFYWDTARVLAALT